jgi:hypothetical protein
VTGQHLAVNIREFTRRIRELHQLVAFDSLSQQPAEFLLMCIVAQQNILVSGAAQSGKSALLDSLDPVQRSMTSGHLRIAQRVNLGRQTPVGPANPMVSGPDEQIPLWSERG